MCLFVLVGFCWFVLVFLFILFVVFFFYELLACLATSFLEKQGFLSKLGGETMVRRSGCSYYYAQDLSVRLWVGSMFVGW